MASLWEEPIKAQVRGIDVSDVTIARVVAGFGIVNFHGDPLGQLFSGWVVGNANGGSIPSHWESY